VDNKKRVIFLAVVLCQVFIAALVVVVTTSIFDTGVEAEREPSSLVLVVGDNIVAAIAENDVDNQMQQLMETNDSSDEFDSIAPFETTGSDASREPLRNIKFSGEIANVEAVDNQATLYSQVPTTDEVIENYVSNPNDVSSVRELDDNASPETYGNYGNIYSTEAPESSEALTVSGGFIDSTFMFAFEYEYAPSIELFTDDAIDSFIAAFLEDQEDSDVYYLDMERLTENDDSLEYRDTLEYDTDLEYDDILGYDDAFENDDTLWYDDIFEEEDVSLKPEVNSFEILDWTVMREIIPRNEDILIYDVETSIMFNVSILALGRHADIEPVTQEDTDAILETRDGDWSWAARPVWVIIGERMFAASMNGQPHAGDTIEDNGITGHFCLWFFGSSPTASTSVTYIRNMSEIVLESWNAHPVVVEEGATLDIEQILNLWWGSDDDTDDVYYKDDSYATN